MNYRCSIYIKFYIVLLACLELDRHSGNVNVQKNAIQNGFDWNSRDDKMTLTADLKTLLIIYLALSAL